MVQTHFDWGMTTETHMVQNRLTPVLQSARWLFSLAWTKCVGWVWLQLCQITDSLKSLTWKLKGTWKFDKSFQFTNNSRAISKWDLCKNELNACLNRNKKHQLRTIIFRFWCMFCYMTMFLLEWNYQVIAKTQEMLESLRYRYQR